MLVLLCRVLFHCKVSCHGNSVKVQGYVVPVRVEDVLLIYVYPIPMLLFGDNSDSPSIVEQLSQGLSFSYNTFISDSS